MALWTVSLALPLLRKSEAKVAVARPIIERFFIFSLIVLAAFSRDGLRWGVIVPIASAIVFRSLHRSGAGLADVGMRRNQIPGSWYLVECSVVLASLMLGMAWMCGTLNHTVPWDTLISKKIGYFAGALVQQVLMRYYFFPAFFQRWGKKSAIFVTVGLFSLAHFPNFPLMFATTFISWFSIRVLLWHEGSARKSLGRSSVWCMALCHAILAVAFSMAVPANIHHNMRVGRGWFTYQSEKPREVIRVRKSSY